MIKKPKVLFLCSGNSCRSQMGEGLCRHFLSDIFDAYSAGLEAQGLNPYAVRVMKEIGIDISRQKSKTVNELGGMEFDFVITVCDQAGESCPFFPAKTKVIHQSFEDPPKLVSNAKSEEEILRHYRRVRDQIKAFVLTLPEALSQS